jgi:hypothetical protein
MAILFFMGLSMITGGYSRAVEDQKNTELLKNSSLVTEADILNRTHYIDLSEPDDYLIRYGFQAQSPSDGKWQMYSRTQQVNSEVFYSIEGCESLMDVYVPGCEIKDIGPDGEAVVVCEEHNPLDTTECKEATITAGDKNFDVQICEEGRTNNLIQFSVKGCDKVQVIYTPDDPNQSWILDTEPKNSMVGFFIMIIGFVFMRGLIFLFGRTFNSRSERFNK